MSTAVSSLPQILLASNNNRYLAQKTITTPLTSQVSSLRLLLLESGILWLKWSMN